MENTSENKINYTSILHKVVHKPLIIEYIFSFLKGEPYKFMQLIEKDKRLEKSINSTFSSTKKNNNLSKELNENIQLIKLFTNFKKTIQLYRNKEINIFHKEIFEEKGIKSKIDPSFLIYKLNYYLEQIKNENKYDKSFIEFPTSGLKDIIYNEEKKSEHIQLVLLPSSEKYLDGRYLKNFLTNDGTITENKEIDVLYCIIDDSEYYNNEHISGINKNIIINDLYFVFINGIKKINIYKAMERYLNLLNKNVINQITLNRGFLGNKSVTVDERVDYLDIYNNPILDMANYILINNKKFSIKASSSKPIPVKLNKKEDFNIIFTLKLYLALFVVFEKQKLDRFVVLNSKYYQSKEPEILSDIKGDVLIIKFNGLSSIENEDFMKNVENYLKCNISYIILYISEEKNNKMINKDSKIELIFPSKKNWILFSEIPTINIFKISSVNDYFEVTNSKDKLISSFSANLRITDYFIDKLFLLKIYKELCFQYYINSEVSFKVFFIKKKGTYELIFVIGDKNMDSIYDKHNNYIFNVNDFINCIEKYLSVKINNISYENFPFNWSDILTSEKDKKRNNNITNKKKTSGNKGFSTKLNQKKMLENELEEEEYFEEGEEDKENNY